MFSFRIARVLGLSIVAGLAFPFVYCDAQDTDKTKEALTAITDTADKICQSASLDFTRQNSQLTGDAKAKLNGTIGRIVDLGVSGSGTLESEKSSGVVEKDIIAAIQTSNNCKLEVFRTLERDLIAGEHSTSQKVPQPAAKLNSKVVPRRPPPSSAAFHTAPSAAIRDCDALAASPDDPSRPAATPGVPDNQIDAWGAEAACRRAIRDDPSPRLYMQLGRALRAGKKYEEAVTSFRFAVTRGNAQAEQELGEMYFFGFGVNQSDAEAVRLFRLAADQGDVAAECDLAQLYEVGRGVEKSPSEAIRLCRMAAEQGLADAQTRLAGYYLGGYMVPQSFSEAARLYQLAANQGNADAQNDLGFMYQNGWGVAQSYQEAIRLYQLAARQGSEAAQSNLRRLGQSW